MQQVGRYTHQLTKHETERTTCCMYTCTMWMIGDERGWAGGAGAVSTDRLHLICVSIYISSISKLLLKWTWWLAKGLVDSSNFIIWRFLSFDQTYKKNKALCCCDNWAWANSSFHLDNHNLTNQSSYNTIIPLCLILHVYCFISFLNVTGLKNSIICIYYMWKLSTIT